MKVLFYGESPCVSTGLAQVSRTILDALQKDGHQVEVVGTNHHMVISYDREIFPYNVVPVLDADKSDPNVVATAVERIHNSNYDMFFCSTDFGRDIPIFQALIEERQKGRDFLITGYYAVDCDIIPPSAFDTLAYCNAKIVYTQHAKRVIETLRPDFKGEVNVMYLATEPDTFYPLSLEEKRLARKELFGVESDDTFLVVSVNRNQSRKDLGRLMAIFHQFHLRHPDSRLYMHAHKNDLGGDLVGIASSLGMGTGPGVEAIFTGSEFNVLQGYTREYMNRVYNAADCLFSTSTGEGWGLSTTEAMAACTPVVVPNNTAFTEIVGENEERGWLVKAGGDIDHRIFLYGMTSNPRDIVHAKSAIEKLEHVYNWKGIARARALKAREWCLQHAKDRQEEKWKNFFAEAEKSIPIGEINEVLHAR